MRAVLKKFNILTLKAVSDQKGFSLLEIIIVLGILGGLVALLFGNLTGAQESAKKKETAVRAGQVYSSLLRFQADTGKWPTTEEGLAILTQSTSGTPYAEEDKLKDAWGSSFEYELAAAQGPKLVSPGPDLTAGTPDDLVFVRGKQVESAPAAGAAEGGAEK